MAVAGVLLDTNVISEMVRPRPSPAVEAWMNQQRPGNLYLSAMTIGELVRGVHRLAVGHKRAAYERWIDEDLARQFEGRVLPFDHSAAVIWGQIMGDGDRRGRPRAATDAQIAATARLHGLTLATCNTLDFDGMDVPLVDPWEA